MCFFFLLSKVTEVDEPLDDDSQSNKLQSIQDQSSKSESMEMLKHDCGSVEHALSEYVRNAPPDISVNIESSDFKTDMCTVIERTDSVRWNSNKMYSRML